MTGDDFILLAGRLAANPKAGEASFRSAVSRAYYGAFHVACAYLAELGLQPPEKPEGHAWVLHRLQGCGHADAKRAGDLLGDLHAERRKADYKLHLKAASTQRFAQISVETAHSFKSSLARCFDELERMKVKSGIIAYESQRGRS